MEEGSEVSADLDRTFTSAFRIGRDSGCEVHVPAKLVSRFHAEVSTDAGTWWVSDLGSTNGTLLNGQPVQRGRLSDGDRIQLGAGAPTLIISVEALQTSEAVPPQTDAVGVGAGGARDLATVSAERRDPRTIDAARSASAAGSDDPDLSLEEVEKKYFDPQSDRPAGKRTEFIRIAFAKVQKKEKRRRDLIVGSVVLLLVVAVGYGVLQSQRVRRMDRLATEFFQRMKAYEVQLVTLRQEAEASGSPELLNRLAAIDSLRMRALESYEGFVRERGLYRRLRTRDEQLIFQTARVFGESEFAVSGEFVQAVMDEIQSYWLSPSGMTRFRRAIQRAEGNGYPPEIVRTLRAQGVPPEFFYLALQESDFNEGAVGPPTRWGRAKGMWQFIPATASRYGLDPGPLSDTGSRDPEDDRQDFRLATDAAARYLRDLHGILTQASGLLVMAAYNWGEHRIAPRLANLPEPRDVFQAEFAEVPEDPASRNYWTFLSEYADRMPEETKDYVIRIFAAAVIGQDPEYFGFDFPNPLSPHL